MDYPYFNLHVKLKRSVNEMGHGADRGGQNLCDITKSIILKLEIYTQKKKLDLCLKGLCWLKLRRMHCRCSIAQLSVRPSSFDKYHHKRQLMEKNRTPVKVSIWHRKLNPTSKEYTKIFLQKKIRLLNLIKVKKY